MKSWKQTSNLVWTPRAMLDQTAVFDTSLFLQSKWGVILLLYTSWWDRLEHYLPFGFHIWKTTLDIWTVHRKPSWPLGVFFRWSVLRKRRGEKSCAVKEHDLSYKGWWKGGRITVWKYFTIRKCLVPKRSSVFWERAQRKSTVRRFKTNSAVTLINHWSQATRGDSGFSDL